MYLENNTREGAMTRLSELQSVMDGLTHSPNITMRMEVGRDITRDQELLSLDNFLLDADVVAIVKSCHDNVLADGTFFGSDDNIWQRFFRAERDIDDIKALFDEWRA